MPLKPSPVVYSCPACRWSHTVAPRSDALLPGEFFESCPRCSYAPLDTRVASVIEAAMARAAQQIKALVR